MARRSGAHLHPQPGKLREGLTRRLCGAVRRVTLDQAAGRRASVGDLRLPPLGEPVWSAFWHIEQSRQGGFGPQAFTYAEIEAWTRLAHNPLAPWEVEAVMSMDVARRAALDAGKGEERPAGITRLVSAHSEVAERMFDRFGEVRDA